MTHALTEHVPPGSKASKEPDHYSEGASTLGCGPGRIADSVASLAEQPLGEASYWPC